MPRYYVEFATEDGARRLPFTIDHDRALGPQVSRVLEELRQSGSVVVGGPADVMSVHWHDRKLDVDRTPAELGLSPDRAIEIRIQETATPSKPPARRALPLTRFFPASVYATVVAGATGALLAWLLQLIASWVWGPPAAQRLVDLQAGLLLGGLVGATVLVTNATQREESMWPGALVGFALGGLGGLAGSLVGTTAASLLTEGVAFAPVAKLLAWLGLGAGVSLGIGASWLPKHVDRFWLTAVSGAGAGLIAGVLMLFPRPFDLWHMAAFLVVGGGTAAGWSVSALRGGAAVVRLETRSAGHASLYRLREWILGSGDSVSLRSAGRGGTEAGGVAVRFDGRSCIVAPRADVRGSAQSRAPVSIAGSRLRKATEVLNGEVVQIGGSAYRFRYLKKKP